MPDHKTEDYKQLAVDYYLIGDNTQEDVKYSNVLLEV